MVPASRAHPVRGKGRSPPVSITSSPPSFSPMCGQRAFRRRKVAMSIDHPEPARPLPDRPNLRHLKDQARDLLEAGAAASVTEAQFKIARLYGFASWPKLKAHVDSLEEIGQLKQAIDTNDVGRVKALMTRNPLLHGAPLGYGK